MINEKTDDIITKTQKELHEFARFPIGKEVIKYNMVAGNRRNPLEVSHA